MKLSKAEEFRECLGVCGEEGILGIWSLGGVGRGVEDISPLEAGSYASAGAEEEYSEEWSMWFRTLPQ